MKTIFTTLGLLLSLISFSHINENNDTKSSISVLTVSSGESRSEAIKFALRDALEQSFGAFISSNTKILNDELVNDEIVSVSSGNIVDYEVISESQLSDGNYSVSVKSNVSLTSFASYMQNKGYEVSFSGKSFGMKIKIQKLNEESEEKAIDNMIIVLKDIIKKSVDFEIEEITEPILKEDWYQTDNLGRAKNDGKDLYNVIIKVKPIINNNYDSFKKFFLETLRSIAMSDSEIKEYSKLNKKVYTFTAFDEKHLNYPFELKDFKLIDSNKLSRFFRAQETINIFLYGNGEYGQEAIIERPYFHIPYKSFFPKFNKKGLDLFKQNLEHLENIYLHNFAVISNGAVEGDEFHYFNPWKIVEISKYISLADSPDRIGIRNLRKTYLLNDYIVSNTGRIYKDFYKSGLYVSNFILDDKLVQIGPTAYSNDNFALKFLRNHDVLKFRNINSINKIDIMLQENQFHIFNFSLNYGDDNWSPTAKKTNNKQVQSYSIPDFGLPSACNKWNSRSSNSYDVYMSMISRKLYPKLRLNARGNQLSRKFSIAWAQIKQQPNWAWPINTTERVSRNGDLIFTNIIQVRGAIKKYGKDAPVTNSDRNGKLYKNFHGQSHVISFGLTLEEIEGITDFKLVNLNSI